MTEVLIIGNDGREDALRQSMEASSEVHRVEITTDPLESLKHFSKN